MSSRELKTSKGIHLKKVTMYPLCILPNTDKTISTEKLLAKKQC